MLVMMLLMADTWMLWRPWLLQATVTTAMVAGSSALVVGLAPEAVGSGIPEVMAYLNGCMMNKVCAVMV
jgi:H+/Cl- antiporter ClcA